VQISGGYTLTEGTVKSSLNNGGNVALGFTLMPSPYIPIGLRIDGSYSHFGLTNQALSQASTATGAPITSGYTNLYGGDADLEIDLPMTPHAREYFFGGVGWYREQTKLKSLTWEQGLVCYYYCIPSSFPVSSTVEKTTTPWLKSWNAGMGFEFALADPGSFFIEARYMRITQGQSAAAQTVFIPIRIGLRF